MLKEMNLNFKLTLLPYFFWIFITVITSLGVLYISGILLAIVGMGGGRTAEIDNLPVYLMFIMVGLVSFIAAKIGKISLPIIFILSALPVSIITLYLFKDIKLNDQEKNEITKYTEQINLPATILNSYTIQSAGITVQEKRLISEILIKTELDIQDLLESNLISFYLVPMNTLFDSIKPPQVSNCKFDIKQPNTTKISENIQTQYKINIVWLGHGKNCNLFSQEALSQIKNLRIVISESRRFYATPTIN